MRSESSPGFPAFPAGLALARQMEEALRAFPEQDRLTAMERFEAFVPRMLADQTEGHVVNTVSMAGLATTPFSGPYDVSKFAAMAATDCLSHDLASVGAPIKVSAVVP